MFLSKKEARNLYNSGVILENRNNQTYVHVFSLCGYHFSSTVKRANKGKQYKLDNPYWKEHSRSIFTKLKMIVSGRVTIIKKKE